MVSNVVEDEGLLAMVRCILRYDPASGHLIWLAREPGMFRGTIAKPPSAQARMFNSTYAGKVAGCVQWYGHRTFTHKGIVLRADRCAWALATGAWPVGQLRHLNGQLDDNRVENMVDDGAEDGPVPSAMVPEDDDCSPRPSLLASNAWRCAHDRGLGRCCLTQVGLPCLEAV